MNRFIPPVYLRNAHVQSLLASIKLRRPWVRQKARHMLASSVSHILSCGDGVRLHGFHTAQTGRSRGLAVLIHGWEGSANSLYLLSSANYLFSQGFDIFRLNLRDHGGSHHLNRELFHSCRLKEVVGALKAIQEAFAPQHLYLTGFSLGGNFALRVAVEAPKAGIPLAKVAAVSPVLDPCRTMEALQNGPAVYHDYFLKKWRRSLTLKHRLFPEFSDLKNLTRFASLQEMTDYFAPRHTGYPSANAYLKGYALTGPRLIDLSVPSLIIASLDDPVIPSQDLSRLARPGVLKILVTRFGGHCGFFMNHRAESWTDRRIVDFFSDSLQEIE